MTTLNEALWRAFDRMIYKCEQTERKSQSFCEGKAEFDKLIRTSVSDVEVETTLYGYVASTQRVAYSTGFIEGAKLMNMLLTKSTDELNEVVLDMLDDRIKPVNMEREDSQ